jgi:hypothetical protein
LCGLEGSAFSRAIYLPVSDHIPTKPKTTALWIVIFILALLSIAQCFFIYRLATVTYYSFQQVAQVVNAQSEALNGLYSDKKPRY